MENYWTQRGGRKNRVLDVLCLCLPHERRREIGRKHFETYFKFGFVRNPWDRVVSLYERSEALQPRNRTIFADFIGKFERLEADWAFVAPKLGVHPELPHWRANQRATLH